MENSADINKFLTAYAKALVTFSPEEVAEFYQVPFIMYAGKTPQIVEKKSEIVAFFSNGMKYYKRITSPKPTTRFCLQNSCLRLLRFVK